MSVDRVVVLCVGNKYRRDDGAALAVARSLAELAPAGVAVRAFEQEPSRLIAAWEGADAAVVVDAVSSGAAPGTLHRFDASNGPIPQRVFRSSTHAFGIAEVIELARSLGTLPRRILVHGIEGGAFGAGEGLSTAVAAAIGPAVAAVAADLTELAGHTSHA